VQKVADPNVIVVVGLGLGQLVVVVGKLEIVAPRVNINRGSKNGRSHGAALDMPTGPTHAPGTFPSRFARFRLFPERKIVGRPFFLTVGPEVALSLGQSLGVAERFGHQLGVVMAGTRVKILDVKVDGPVGFVGIVPFDNLLYELDNLRTVLAHTGEAVGGKYV